MLDWEKEEEGAMKELEGTVTMAKLYSLTVEVNSKKLHTGWNCTGLFVRAYRLSHSSNSLSLLLPTFSPSPPSGSGDPRERCKEFSVYFFIISS